VLSGRGLCDELITRPENSYRLWCVVVCDPENLKNEEAMIRAGSQCHRKKYIYIYIYCINIQVANGILNARFAQPAEALCNLNPPGKVIVFRKKILYI
jgi:hypothetical protein